MGTLTNNQLQDEILSNLANRTDFTVGVGTRLERFLNMSQDRIARLERFREMKKYSKETITNSGDITVDKFLALPNQFRSGYSLTLQDGTSSHKLDYVDPLLWDTRFPRVQETSRDAPRLYTLFDDDNIELFPIPDASYEVRLRWERWPTVFSALTQVSDFDHLDDVLIALATSWANLTLGQMEQSTVYFTIFRSMMAEIHVDAQRDSLKNIVPEFEVGGGAAPGNYWLDPFVQSI